MQWKESPAGQHIELGIAEHNLFLALGAFGLAHELSGGTLLPIGTLYDPFVSRGLDALYHALYAGGRFIVAATPSGVSLSPEGGAHQSVITPGIGVALPAIAYYEPTFAHEVEWILLDALRGLLRRGDAESLYLRLSTKPIDQSLAPAPSPAHREAVLRGRLPADRRAERARLRSGGQRGAPLRGRRHGARGGGGEPRAGRERASARASSRSRAPTGSTAACATTRPYSRPRDAPTKKACRWSRCSTATPTRWPSWAARSASRSCRSASIDFGQSGARGDLYRHYGIDAPPPSRPPPRRRSCWIFFAGYNSLNPMSTLTEILGNRDLRRELKSRSLGPGAVLTDPDELMVYESDGLTLFRALADFVVFPEPPRTCRRWSSWPTARGSRSSPAARAPGSPAAACPPRAAS